YINVKELRKRKDIKITDGMVQKIHSIYEFLKRNKTSSVSITSPKGLLREIFSVKGEGTYIKYFSIRQAKDFANVDKKKLSELINDAFRGRSLVKSYFELTDVKRIYYEQEYAGCAIIRRPFKMFKSVDYLDKLAVRVIHQGTGLGHELFNKVINNHRKLIWRSNKTNDANEFYCNKCTGCLKTKDWNIYWININEEKAVKLAKLVEKLPRTII
ncbi:MAG: hypothetical protein N3E37_04875, partial [Candidatus Micrarchaeota archaeon]|nr:hypothetical protein [Candidatus Micrarchaeota archaeon]